MKLGYACINTQFKTTFKTCRLETMRREGMKKIRQITLHNLELVRHILLWNASKDILFYRFSSNIIPFASHDEMTWRWWEDWDVIVACERIKQIRDMFGMRLSMHPPQFTSLSSPRADVIKNAHKDLWWHDKFTTMIGGTDLIIHGGGAYGDIDSASIRFVNEYNNLSDSLKSKLRLENDDKTYSLYDVMNISIKCGVPICYDIHHHNCHNVADYNYSHVLKTWEGFGTPKVHISTGKEHRYDLRHHQDVSLIDYEALIDHLNGTNVDIMFESKGKEQSVLKIMEVVQV